MNHSANTSGSHDSILKICRLVFAASITALTLSSCHSMSPEPGDRLTVSGRVEADETRLAVLMPGKVSSVKTSEGASVRRGEELLELDSTMFKNQLKSLDELIRQAESEKKAIVQMAAKLKKTPVQFSATSTLSQPAFKTTDPVSRIQNSASSTHAQDVASNNKSSAESSGLRDKELAEQLKQLDDAQTVQLKVLNEATASMLATVDGAYARETLMLKEGREEAQRNSKTKGLFSTIAKAKLAGIEEVFNAKEKALTQAYQAQRKAITESAASKETALKESIESRKSSVRQLYSAKNLMSDEFTTARAKIQESMENQKNLLKSAIRAEGSEQAKVTLQKIREAGVRGQSQIQEMQTEQTRARIAMLDTELLKANAMRTELKNKIELCSITSPIDGVCVMRSVQPGELVVPGPTLLKLADQNALYVRALVTEGDLASLKLGQSAEVSVDSAAAKPIRATLTAIDSTPCFTPKGVYFKEDRVKEAFGIKLTIDEKNSVAKPGMPVDVTIFFAGKANE